VGFPDLSNFAQSVMNLVPRHPRIGYKIVGKKLPPITTPWGNLVIKGEALVWAQNCKDNNGKTRLLGVVMFKGGAELCVGPGSEFGLDLPGKERIQPLLVGGSCPKCEDKTQGTVKLKVYGKGGLVFTGEAGISITLFPIHEAGEPDPHFQIGVNDYVGAQVCGKLEGLAKRQWVLN